MSHENKQVKEDSLNIGEGGLEKNAAKYPKQLVAPQCDSQKSQVPPSRFRKKSSPLPIYESRFLVKKTIFRILFVEK